MYITKKLKIYKDELEKIIRSIYLYVRIDKSLNDLRNMLILKNLYHFY